MGFMERFGNNLERFEWNRYQHYIYRDLYRELVQIITEVQVLNSEAALNINGTGIIAGLVAEVFQNLTSEHLQSVCEKYNKIDYYIRNKKTYLRAMLYNEVFEYDATITNDVNVNEGLAGV